MFSGPSRLSQASSENLRSAEAASSAPIPVVGAASIAGTEQLRLLGNDRCSASDHPPGTTCDCLRPTTVRSVRETTQTEREKCPGTRRPADVQCGNRASRGDHSATLERPTLR